MNRSVIDRASIDAAVERRRARLTPAVATEWVVSKAVVIPAAFTSLVNRILHRAPSRAPVPPSLRRHAVVYVWRPTFGPDGLPDSDGEIVPLEEFSRPRKTRPVS